MPFPLSFRDCLFDEELVLDEARVRTIDLGGTLVNGIKARTAHIDGDFVMRNARVRQALDLRGTEVGGSFDARDAVIGSPGTLDVTDAASDVDDARDVHPVLGAPQTKIAGSVRLERVHAHGPVSFSRSDIGGELQLERARIAVDRGNAVTAAHAQIGGRVVLTRAEIVGTVSLFHARIAGLLNAEDATLTGHRHPKPRQSMLALNAERAQIDGTVIVRKATLHGGMRLFSGRFGALELDASTIGDAPYGAVDASLARVDGPVRLREAVLEGPLSLFNAEVNGQLNGSGAAVRSSVSPDAELGDVAITAEGARIAGAAMLGGAHVRGRIRLFGASLGTLEAAGASITNRHRVAVELVRATVNGMVLLDEMRCSGRIVTYGSSIGDDLSVRGARLRRSPGTVPRSDPPLLVMLVRTSVRGRLEFTGVNVEGGVALHASRVGGDIEVSGATLGDGIGALVAPQLQCDGTFRLQSSTLRGVLDLRYATVGVLFDDEPSWPRTVLVEGFRYASLGPTSLSRRTRIRLLKRAPAYRAQPYLELARAFRSAGRETDARKTNIARHNVAMRRSFLSAIDPWRWLLRLLVGHGYAPWRAAVPVLVLFAIGSALAADARDADAFRATRPPAGKSAPRSSVCTATYPCVSPAVYALDSILPVVNLHQREFWQPTRTSVAGDRAMWFTTIATLSGWILVTLVLAGLTNAVRRE